MYTFGYSFKTWDNPKSFADAPSILKYLNEASNEFKIKSQIKYQKRAVSYNFNSDQKLWSIITLNTATGKKSVYTCNFIFSCSGYYNYDEGYSPEFKCQSDYKGDIIHPQKWPENFDCTNKKIVVIGVDTMSSILDYNDRNTCVLFGDGAGAVLLEPSNENGIIDSLMKIDGSGGDYLYMPAGGSLNPATKETVEKKMHYVKQDGANVFKQARFGVVGDWQKILPSFIETVHELIA